MPVSVAVRLLAGRVNGKGVAMKGRGMASMDSEMFVSGGIHRWRSNWLRRT